MTEKNGRWQKTNWPKHPKISRTIVYKMAYLREPFQEEYDRFRETENDRILISNIVWEILKKGKNFTKDDLRHIFAFLPEEYREKMELGLQDIEKVLTNGNEIFDKDTLEKILQSYSKKKILLSNVVKILMEREKTIKKDKLTEKFLLTLKDFWLEYKENGEEIMIKVFDFIRLSIFQSFFEINRNLRLSKELFKNFNNRYEGEIDLLYFFIWKALWWCSINVYIIWKEPFLQEGKKFELNKNQDFQEDFTIINFNRILNKVTDSNNFTAKDNPVFLTDDLYSLFGKIIDNRYLKKRVVINFDSKQNLKDMVIYGEADIGRYKELNKIIKYWEIGIKKHKWESKCVVIEEKHRFSWNNKKNE